MNAYSKEVDQLIEEAVRLANSKHREVYIFSGTKGSTQAYTATRDGTTNQISDISFEGNESSARLILPLTQLWKPITPQKGPMVF